MSMFNGLENVSYTFFVDGTVEKNIHNILCSRAIVNPTEKDYDDIAEYYIWNGNIRYGMLDDCKVLSYEPHINKETITFYIEGKCTVTMPRSREKRNLKEIKDIECKNKYIKNNAILNKLNSVRFGDIKNVTYTFIK